jgi:hypothetical protein
VIQGCSNLVFLLVGEDINAIQTMSEQFQLCEWEYCRLGKLHRYSEITSESWDAPDYSICLHTPLAVIQPLWVTMEKAEYCTTILLPKPSQNLPSV